jgi:hypothetical protein
MAEQISGEVLCKIANGNDRYAWIVSITVAAAAAVVVVQ